MRNQIAWALVADAQHGRVLERRSLTGPWLQIEAVAQVIPPSRALGRRRPDRVHDSVGDARHAAEPREDPHEAEKTAFARRLAERLEDAARHGDFDRLLLVAPPPFLGRLREVLGDAARARLHGDLALDLTHAPIEEVVAHLKEARPV